ncbi:MAG: LbtU family siderophore porin [Gammaproteobacteria bacterium]|nr:LbtU family siderophore porin [Gammaproteobacteria bacterium]
MSSKSKKINKKIIFQFLFLLGFSHPLFAVTSTAPSEVAKNKKFVGMNSVPADVDLTRSLNAVGTGPYFGIGSNYDGSDLVVLQPNIHKDLSLLIQHQRTAKFTKEYEGPRSPYVQISGYLEAQTTVENQAHNNINLTASNLDLSAWVNNWLTAYTNFGVETDDTKDQHFRMIMGFITLGNLNYSPFYVSAGQMFVPFGSFSTGTSAIGAIPRSVGRILEQAVSAGFYQENGLHVSGAVYDGKTQNSYHDNIDQYAGTVSYTQPYNVDNWLKKGKIRAGASYTNNIAESNVIRTIFINNAPLDHYVPAFDLFANASVGPFVARWELVQAIKHFSIKDLTQAGKPVKISSFMSELEYDTNIFNKGTAFVLHYSRIFQGSVASRVKHQYGVTTSVNILRDTLLSFEYAHQTTYSNHNTLPVPFGNNFAVLDTSVVSALNSSFSGKDNNFVVVTLDLFF